MTEKERYRNDPEFRERKKARTRERYWQKKRQAIDDMLAAKRISAINKD